MPPLVHLRLAASVAGIATGLLALSGCSTLGHIIDTQSNAGATTGVFDIQVGDCLDDADSADAQGVVLSVPTVPCDADHDSEAFKEVTVSLKGGYPGNDALESAADTQCQSPFENFVHADAADTMLDYTYYYPTADSWRRGDRQILCLVYNPDGQVRGTLKGKGPSYPVP